MSALASEMDLARNKPTKQKQKSKPVRNSAATPQGLSCGKFEIHKAKAEVFDRKNRQPQSEVKQALQLELEKYGRCAYFETKLQFFDCYVDHIQPMSKGGLSTESNCAIITERQGHRYV